MRQIEEVIAVGKGNFAAIVLCSDNTLWALKIEDYTINWEKLPGIPDPVSGIPDSQ